MSETDDAENNVEVTAPARPSSRRSTQDEQIDLDYDEESNHGGSIEAANFVDEKPEEKEEGELEDGELSSSDEDPEPAKVAVKQPISNVSPPRGRKKITAPVSTAKPNETAWERGLREAREAMRRANKVREEPDFETKRLVAAPPLRRSSRNNTDSDHSPSPGPRRRNHSRSDSPRGGIPSLLDIRTSPPPRRLPPKEVSRRGALTPIREQPQLRPIRRRSPSYGSRSRSRTPPTWPQATPPRRRHPLDLGPQVIYPNGRPCPRREGQQTERDTRQREHKRRDPSPPPHHDRQDRAGRSRGLQELKKGQKKLTVVSTSPISSDSDDDSDNSRKGSSSQRGGRNGESISDPWARRKTAERRRRRSSSGSSNSDSSRSTIPGSRKKKSRSSSRSSSSSSDSDSDYEKKKKKIAKDRSPPRGDISSYRIPKKKPARKEEDAVEAFFSKKTSDLPAAFRKRRRDSETGNGKKVKMEEISGSESDDSGRSKCRTPLPPPSFSSTTNKKKPKSPSPISEDSDEDSPPPPSRQQLDDISPPPPADLPSSPPPRSPSTDSMDLEEKQRRRKQELLAQLREVDNELAKRRSVLGT